MNLERKIIILRPLRFCVGGASNGPDVKDRDAGCVPDTPKERSFTDGSLEWPSKFTKPKRAQYNSGKSSCKPPASRVYRRNYQGIPMKSTLLTLTIAATVLASCETKTQTGALVGT